MTENQEKELFIALGSLVKGVTEIQSDVRVIKTTLDEHSQILNQHSDLLNEHSKKLDSLDAKTDSIAAQLMKNDIAISERVTTIEREVEGLGGKIH